MDDTALVVNTEPTQMPFKSTDSKMTAETKRHSRTVMMLCEYNSLFTETNCRIENNLTKDDPAVLLTKQN